MRSAYSGGSRISQRGANPRGTNLLSSIICAENCMKMKKNWIEREGSAFVTPLISATGIDNRSVFDGNMLEPKYQYCYLVVEKKKFSHMTSALCTSHRIEFFPKHKVGISASYFFPLVFCVRFIMVTDKLAEYAT